MLLSNVQFLVLVNLPPGLATRVGSLVGQATQVALLLAAQAALILGAQSALRVGLSHFRCLCFAGAFAKATAFAYVRFGHCKTYKIYRNGLVLGSRGPTRMGSPRSGEGVWT